MGGIVVTGLLHFGAARTTGQRLTKATVRQQVEETIEVIRPALQADGGDIFLREVDEDTGVVTVGLVGACGTCPVSTDTLKAGIERIMKDRIDGVTEVVAV
jgi:Fe-S cluster biogenesis protein NfuA